MAENANSASFFHIPDKVINLAVQIQKSLFLFNRQSFISWVSFIWFQMDVYKPWWLSVLENDSLDFQLFQRQMSQSLGKSFYQTFVILACTMNKGIQMLTGPCSSVVYSFSSDPSFSSASIGKFVVGRLSLSSFEIYFASCLFLHSTNVSWTQRFQYVVLLVRELIFLLFFPVKQGCLLIWPLMDCP